MTSATLIADPQLTAAERRRQDDIDQTIRRVRKRRRNGFWSRPRGSLGGSPPGAGGRLLQL